MIRLNRACILVIDGKKHYLGDVFADYPQDVDPSYFDEISDHESEPDPEHLEVQDDDENQAPEPDHGSALQGQE